MNCLNWLMVQLNWNYSKTSKDYLRSSTVDLMCWVKVYPLIINVHIAASYFMPLSFYLHFKYSLQYLLLKKVY